MSTVTPTVLPRLDGVWLYEEYRLKFSTDTYAVYDLWDPDRNPPSWWDNTDDFAIQVTFATNTWSDYGSKKPHFVIENGPVIELHDTSQLLYSFTKPTEASWLTPGSGLSVTSITRNESNNLITVLHAGTLTSTDVNHTISNVSSSITNLQTITNGSTFTASGANGTHVIRIGDEILTYFIYNTTSGRQSMTSNNNLVVTFPTTDNAWLSNFSALNSETLTPYVSYSETRTAIRLSVMDYTMWITFNLSYNETQEGFSVLTEIYDWRSANSSNNYAHVYSSTLQWVYPEATFESTGSADTLITLPTNEIVTSFNWNFASIPPPEEPVANSTRGTNGYPDRYPLIMTNLFNRQRSIYAIGMTHKDTYDLFL